MKNLKNLCKMLPILLLAVFTSCKKNDAKPVIDADDPVIVNPVGETPINMSELLDYYLVSERKTSNTRLAIMYFTKEGDVIKANLHGIGHLRSKEVTASNSSFSFNTDGFGTFSYTLEKDATGRIKLKSFNYNGGDDLNYAMLIKKSETVVFANSSFKTGDLLFKFKNPGSLEWDIQSKVIGYTTGPPPLNLRTPVFATSPELTLPYYSLLDLGFKSNNDQFLGIAVPSWKDAASPIMLIENGGATVLRAVKQ